MAVLGIPIGISFAVGVIGGPLLAGIFGTSSLFWLTGFLGLANDLILARYLPEGPPKAGTPAPMGEVIRNRRLAAFSFGGFLMNFFMSSFFFFFPLIVTGQHKLRMTQYYQLLLPMMVISGFTMFGFALGADRGWAKPLAAAAYLFFLPSSLLLFRPDAGGFDPARLTSVLIAGTLFYIGFTGLEPVLPSLVSKSSPESAYGSALGTYNTMQYLGSFVGGSMAGTLSHFPPEYMMITLMAGGLLGFLLMLATPAPADARPPENKSKILG